MKYDLLHIQGKPYVLVPLHEYRDLSGGAAQDDLPDDILDELIARKESPIKILRRYHGMTQSDLARESGISRPYLTEIEGGKKDGSLRAMRAIADALKVNMGLLT